MTSSQPEKGCEGVRWAVLVAVWLLYTYWGNFITKIKLIFLARWRLTPSVRVAAEHHCLPCPWYGNPINILTEFPFTCTPACPRTYTHTATHSPPEPFLPLNKFEVLASTKVIYQNNFTRGATFFRIFGRRKSETIKLFEIQNDSEVFVSPRKNNEYKLDLNISKFIIRLDCFFL